MPHAQDGLRRTGELSPAMREALLWLANGYDDAPVAGKLARRDRGRVNSLVALRTRGLVADVVTDTGVTRWLLTAAGRAAAEEQS